MKDKWQWAKEGFFLESSWGGLSGAKVLALEHLLETWERCSSPSRCSDRRPDPEVQNHLAITFAASLHEGLLMLFAFL